MYTSTATPYTRTAIFPHGAHKKPIGVVSDRAIKHVHELTNLAAEGAVELPPRLAAVLGEGEGARRPVSAAVLFVVNRCARRCHVMQPPCYIL